MRTKTEETVKVLLFCFCCLHEWEENLTKEELKSFSQFSGVKACPFCHEDVESPALQLNLDI